ncbi:Arm DNA-binding domain-containing protein [Bacillus pumilus]|uniref:Arm DNA-binding domain-containing protein n=2 Tax=Bacillaceae TaxID=186817 RepID=UPI002FFDFDDC
MTDQRSYCHIPVGNGQHKKLTKSFDKKSEAKRWALENELEKGNGKQLAERSTTFAV